VRGRGRRLRAGDLLALGVAGLRGRPLRAVLSALGIALGIATMVSVLGISSSSRAQLVAQIDALGTNLLTVTPGQSFSGATSVLPATSTAMVRRIGPVLAASSIGAVNANVYRNALIPAVDTAALTVYSTDPRLAATVEARLQAGRFLDAATTHLPAAVLGADAAQVLGIDRVGVGSVWLGGHDFAVIGVLSPVTLAPELDRAALIGLPVAERLFGAQANPTEIYVRAAPAALAAVANVLPATAEPASPQNVAVADPTDALVARADATAAFQGLFLALGGVALLVGGVGIANVMVISVLERRSEVGLRRALGATRAHIGAQFVAESALLAVAGGATGALVGSVATSLTAAARHWSTVVPLATLGAAVGLALAIGVLAGAYPALRATRLSPSEALRAL